MKKIRQNEKGTACPPPPVTTGVTLAISAAEYRQLRYRSEMLGQIANVVRRYARTPQTTTYECVVALNGRVRELNAKVRNHKKHPRGGGYGSA